MALAGPSPFFLSSTTTENPSDSINTEDQIDDDDVRGYDDQLPIFLTDEYSKYRTASRRSFPDAESVVNAVIDGTIFLRDAEFLSCFRPFDFCSMPGNIKLRRAEGTKVAHIDRAMFIDGEVYFSFVPWILSNLVIFIIL